MMQENTNLAADIHSDVENPLVWPILEVLRSQSSGWKVHTLASRLNELGFIHTLDAKPEKDLFKRNFLIMNALYQLQETLYPDQWLQVEAMDIELMPSFKVAGHTIDVDDPLRDYYVQWSNYDAEDGEVKRLLNEFWTRYHKFVGGAETHIDRVRALELFELAPTATRADIRKQWRRLALRWHPDRDNGDADKFRVMCEAWNVLRHH